MPLAEDKILEAKNILDLKMRLPPSEYVIERDLKAIERQHVVLLDGEPIYVYRKGHREFIFRSKQSASYWARNEALEKAREAAHKVYPRPEYTPGQNWITYSSSDEHKNHLEIHSLMIEYSKQWYKEHIKVIKYVDFKANTVARTKEILDTLDSKLSTEDKKLITELRKKLQRLEDG